MFAREGYFIIGSAIVIALVLALIGWQFGPILRGLLLVLAFFVVAFTLYFFRDPKRTPPAEASNLLLSPADGKVVVLQDIDYEPLYIKGPAKQLSIFLSPLNVHVNRSPAAGVIEFDEYVSGDYLVAWHPKASEKNERSQLGLRHPSGTKIVFKQIAGAVARRIVYHIRVGDKVKAGERFGIVKFGSRMDILVPPHVTFDVKIDDRVQGGLTVIGHIPDEVPATLDQSTAAREG